MGWKKGQAVRLVPLSQANGRVLDIYRDVQRVFGVPHVSSFFQYLGTTPRFLDSFWAATRPIAETEEFLSCAHCLRADALNRVQSNLTVPSLKPELARQQFSLGACQELKDCINFFRYSVPVTLLLASFLSESFKGPVGNPALPRTPAPTPKPHRHIVLIDEETAPSAVKSIFADIRFATGADVVHTVYRAFARWPDFLQSYWASVKPIAISESFLQSESAVRERAIQTVKEVPGPIEFNSNELARLGMNPTEAHCLKDITAMFVHSLAAALLNVSVARIALEGSSLKSAAEDSGTTSTPKTEILR